jgi:hypothetical protein
MSVKFKLKKVNPNQLTVHPILEETGFNNSPDKFFADMLKEFGHYERPVIDLDGQLITHSAEALAAVMNQEKSIEVWEVNMDSISIRKFIFLKHKYYRRKMVASYASVKFWENYFTKNPEGIEFGKTIEGSTRQKVARMMQTSDSTIKRLKFIGENVPEKLGLIDEGLCSLKEAEECAKKKKWIPQQLTVSSSVTDNAANRVNDRVEELSGNASIEKEQSVPTPVIFPIEKDSMDAAGTTYSTTTSAFQFLQGTLSVEGLGEFEMSTTGSVPVLKVNGVEIPNSSYHSRERDDVSKFSDVNTFGFKQPGKDGFAIQIFVHNISKLSK